MHMGRIVTVRHLLVAVIIAVAAFPAAAQPPPVVQVKVTTERGEIAPHGDVAVAIELVITPGWHVFWRNPGAVGLPTEVQWSLPPGWSATDVEWPQPARFVALGLVSYGYEGRARLLASVRAASDATPGRRYQLKTTVKWLACKDICIPGRDDFSIPLVVRDSPMKSDAGLRKLSDTARERPSVRAPAGSTAAISLPAGALLLALFGGLLLNLMPCVLPVLALKSLAIAGRADGDARQGRREGLAFGAGVVAAFVLLGLAVTLLQRGGHAIGWGFQLQSPRVVTFLAYLMFVIGLGFSGAFEWPGISIRGVSLQPHGAPGAFLTGILAVVLATPCSAPFMATALGYALTQPAATAVIVYLALGAGFALPIVVISMSPRVTRLLPRPGPWMLRLRQALSFPMYATAAWLLWVLSQQAGQRGLAWALAGLVGLAFAAWAWELRRTQSSFWRVSNAALAAAAIAATAATLFQISLPASHAVAAAAAPLQSPYSRALSDRLVLEQRAIFINATAAWCITCLVNEERVLSDAAVRRMFAEGKIHYLIADWTGGDSDVTALLAAHGRAGVPLYLYYPPASREPEVLPQILTVETVRAAIRGASPAVQPH
jgi:thiol:disulfide interchange protein